MASQHRAGREILPRFHNRAFRIFPHINSKRYVLPALLLCLLLSFTASCAAFTSSQAGQANDATGAKGSGKITYVAIGASDSFGIGTNAPYTENWPTDLTYLLGSNHIHLIDAGIPGVIVHEALSLELPIAVDAHPNLVTIWLGVNDIVDKVPVSSYARDLNTLLSKLRTAVPDTTIAIANIPDLTLLPYFSSYDTHQLSQVIQAYNAAVANAAQSHHAILVDLTLQNYNLAAHPEYISSDGLHPNDIGYQQLANLFFKAIKAAQKQATTT